MWDKRGVVLAFGMFRKLEMFIVYLAFWVYKTKVFLHKS